MKKIIFRLHKDATVVIFDLYRMTMLMLLNKGQVKIKKTTSFVNPVTTHSRNLKFSWCYQHIKEKRSRNYELI